MRYFRLMFIAIIFLIGVSVIILGGIYLYKKTENKVLTEHVRKQATGSFIRLDAGITHYELSGPDTGKVVVLLNDLGHPYYTWDSTFHYLVKQGYRVLRYDQYGCGYSDRPDYTYNKYLYINQLYELIKTLHLKPSFSLIGASFGGMIATDFSNAYPDKIDKLILIDPIYESQVPNKPAYIVKYYELIHPYEHAERQLSDFKYPENYHDWAKKYSIQMQYNGFVNAQVSTLYNYHYNALKSNTLLNTKHKPILLIWGRDDEIEPFKYSDSVRHLLKTTFFPVDDAGHLPHIEQAGLVNDRIAKFLKENK